GLRPVPEVPCRCPASLKRCAAGAGDEVVGGGVVNAVAGMYRLQAKGDREHRLANSGRPAQQGVGLLLDEAQRGELGHQATVERRLRGEVELLERLGGGEVGEAQASGKTTLLGR